MRKKEYDFLAWTIFPSSAKLINDEIDSLCFWGVTPTPSVTPGASLRASVQAKGENILGLPSHIRVDGYNGAEYRMIGQVLAPKGTFDWRSLQGVLAIPSDVIAVRCSIFGGGSGNPKAPGVTWYDDLKVFQDGVLIYSNDFSKWDPVIGAGVGAPIGGVAGYLLKEPLGPMVSEVVGAVLGGVLGGGVGLLTAMGLVPQIPIPTLEALEVPEAPARMGKYQITG